MTGTRLNVIDRLRNRPQMDINKLTRSELQTAREELGAETQNNFEIAERIKNAAAGRPMTSNQKRDFDTAADRCEEAAELTKGVEAALARGDVDYSTVLRAGGSLHLEPSDASYDARRAELVGSDHAYRDGVPLHRDQTMSGFVRSQGAVRHGEDDLSLGKYVRGMIVGDWAGADRERRAMAEGALSTGGYMVPTLLSSEIIDKARNKTAVFQAGARLVPMANQTVDIAKWTGDPAVAWHTEAASITPSDGTLGRVRLQAKALAGLTVVSRELLEDAAEIDTQLLNAFAAQFALTIDKAALYAGGTPPEPQGIKGTSGITTLSMGVNGAAPTNYDFLVDAVGTLRDLNEYPTGTIYSPRTARELGKLKDTTNQPLQLPGYIADHPLFDTNQIPNNLTQGASGSASDAFTADWSQLLVGVRTQLQIQILTERYADAGQVAVLCWWRGDIQVARPAAFAVTVGLL